MAHPALALATAALLTALLALPATGAVVQNQVRNASLEAWTGNVPDHWAVESGNVTPSPFATDGTLAAALRALPDDLGNHRSVLAYRVPENALPAAQGVEDAPIVPGAFYEFSFDAAGVYHGKGQGNCTVSWYGLLSGALLRVDTILVPDATGYAHFTVQLQAPADPLGQGDVAGSAVLRFAMEGQSSDIDVNLYVDNIAFGLSSPALPA
jgi:hypothetical protein